MASTDFQYIVQRDAPLAGSAVEDLRVQVGWDRMPGYYDLIPGSLLRPFHRPPVRAADCLVNVISDGVADAFLVDLMVHPDYQRRGLGLALVQQAIQALKADGIRCIEVLFDPSLEDFYRRCGFHILRAGIIDTWDEAQG